MAKYVEHMTDKVVDAVSAHVMTRLQGHPMLVRKVAELLLSKVTGIVAKHVAKTSLDQMKEEVAAAVGDVEPELSTLLERFHSQGLPGTSLDEVMEEAKGGVREELKEQLMELVSAHVQFKEKRSEAILRTLCGFKQDQTEADLSGKELRLGDARLIAWDLAVGTFVSASLKSLK